MCQSWRKKFPGNWLPLLCPILKLEKGKPSMVNEVCRNQPASCPLSPPWSLLLNWALKSQFLCMGSCQSILCIVPFHLAHLWLHIRFEMTASYLCCLQIWLKHLPLEVPSLNFTRSCLGLVWWGGRCLPGFPQPRPSSYGSCRTWARKTCMWIQIYVSSHFVIRLSTSCLSWVCLEPPPTLWWRNRPIPFLRFWLREWEWGSEVKDLTCSTEQGRRQWEDTKLRGERAQPKDQISYRLFLLP